MILNRIKEHKQMIERIENDEQLQQNIQQSINLILDALKANGHLYLCGNGGSAADAQHIAAELSGRYLLDREPLAAESLHSNSSFVTAVANDYSFEDIYARAIKAKGRSGDVLIGISTSGHSANVVNAIVAAKELGIKTIAWTGSHGGKLADLVDLCLNVPSQDTPRIQEAHILIGHIICEAVELGMQ